MASRVGDAILHCALHSPAVVSDAQGGRESTPGRGRVRWVEVFCSPRAEQAVGST